MESFKYQGTPEQMAKVAEWALKNGAKWYKFQNKYSEQHNGLAYCNDYGGSDLLYIDFYNSACEPPLTLTPELELAIFGRTEGITGKIEDEWIENTGKMPVESDILVDTKWDDDAGNELGDPANMWNWSEGAGITHWRLHKPDSEWFSEPKTNYVKPETAGKVAFTNDNVPVNIPESTSIEVMEAFRLKGTAGLIKSDGGSSSYYKLTIKTKDGSFECETGDVIAAMVGNDFCLGNALKALRRIWCASEGVGKDGIDMKYDSNKISFFVKDFIERQERV